MHSLLLLFLFILHITAYDPKIRITFGDTLKLKCHALPMRSVYSEGTCYYTYIEKFTEKEALSVCQRIFYNAEVVTDKCPVLEQLATNFDDFHGSDKTADKKRVLCSYDASSKCEDDEQMIGNGLCVHVSEKRDYNGALQYCRTRKSSLPVIFNSHMNQVVAGILTSNQASGGWLLQQTVSRGGKMGWQFPYSLNTINYFPLVESNGNTPMCKKEEGMIIQTLGQCSTFGSWRFEDISRRNSTVCIRPSSTDMTPVPPSNTSPTQGPLPVTIITKKPTVTKAPKIYPPSDILQPLKYFYNAWHIRHAFCTEARCMHYINRNDVGFSPTFKAASSLGRLITHFSRGMDRMKKICPAGWKKLKRLSFHKTDGRYIAQLNGVGLEAGWVATEKGLCGANIAIKEWGCAMSKDLMYAVDLQWNTWYRGRVKRGGKPVFWLWK